MIQSIRRHCRRDRARSSAAACVISTRTSETAYAHFYGVSFQREFATNFTGSVEHTGSTGRKLYDLADPNKIGAELVLSNR